MVKDARPTPPTTRSAAEVAEARNQLDSLIYTTEKSLKESATQVDSGEKQSIEDAVAKAEKGDGDQ